MFMIKNVICILVRLCKRILNIKKFKSNHYLPPNNNNNKVKMVWAGNLLGDEYRPLVTDTWNSYMKV